MNKCKKCKNFFKNDLINFLIPFEQCSILSVIIKRNAKKHFTSHLRFDFFHNLEQ